MTEQKKKAPRNRTIELSETEAKKFFKELLFPKDALALSDCRDKTLCGDSFKVLSLLPPKKFDLLFADPPYNLNKNFGENSFQQTSDEEYENWLDSWLKLAAPLLKPTASIYICGDWRSSAAIQRAGSRYFKLRNRITWEREKGRGAKENWKSCSEDIWFFTVSDKYTFNLDSVRLRRQVIAPYRENGQPKDWEDADDGRFRFTHPSNLWTDLTVPFWSMPENTDHPTQKPEKLLAKIILASTNENDVVLDPFSGSGTTSVAAKKLGRHFVGIEKDKKYCCLTEKRLAAAEKTPGIQGYTDGVFWERNTHEKQISRGKKK
ncbi:MAG TPA: site-specific DNA-methyltransferase [Pyrinomonadaceae bacterium]|jgi:site-specific DNA-methyltransferase (adenine-specific)|nr:site-specific DNA-methyltransferase [Pyrinomonadaceae bacterium]